MDVLGKDLWGEVRNYANKSWGKDRVLLGLRRTGGVLKERRLCTGEILGTKTFYAGISEMAGKDSNKQIHRVSLDPVLWSCQLCLALLSERGKDPPQSLEVGAEKTNSHKSGFYYWSTTSICVSLSSLNFSFLIFKMDLRIVLTGWRCIVERQAICQPA